MATDYTPEQREAIAACRVAVRARYRAQVALEQKAAAQADAIRVALGLEIGPSRLATDIGVSRQTIYNALGQ